MKDVLVVYKSKYGATERYAKWIAEEMGCEAKTVKEVNRKDLMEYRMLIFGGGLYAGQIGGISALTRHYEYLKDKELFVFTSGLTQPEENGYYTYLFTRNFTEKMRRNIHFFAFPGALDKEKLGRIDRWMMNMVMKERAKNDPEHAADYLAMKMDFVDRKYVQSLVEKAKGIQQAWEEKRQRQEQLRREAQEQAEMEAQDE